MSLYSVLMWRYTNIPSVVEEGGKKEKRSSLSQLCLEGLLRIFTTCQQRYPDKMAQLLSTMGWTSSEKAVHFVATTNIQELIIMRFFEMMQKMAQSKMTKAML